METSVSVTKVFPLWPVPGKALSCPTPQLLCVFCDGAEASLTHTPPPILRCVSICSLAFSMDGMFLSASSNTETVHIFKLEAVREK